MPNNTLATALALTLVSACASTPAPAPETPSEPQATAAPAAPAEPAPVAAAPTPAPAPEPTPEEKAKAEAAAKLEKERAAMLAEHQAEVARLTPELHAQFKTLAEKAYPSLPAALKVILASNHRRPGNAARDADRHPLETLKFLGIKPNQTVLEYGPGEGWYTEILAPTLAAKGKLIATNGDPNGPADQRGTFYAQRFKLFLETAPELYGKVEVATIDGKAPKLEQEGTVDTVLLFRSAHGMVNQGTLGAWLKEFHEALKPRGVLGIEQHRAVADADPAVSAKKGYLPEKWLIEQVEAAGFKLAGKSEVNANPKDTKDHPEGVWTLPPSFALGDKDRDKYAAIGESDRMTLKFTKVPAKPVKPVTTAEAPAAAPASPATPAPAAAPARSAAPASAAAPAPAKSTATP
jgi:predicted methyltransferase